MTAARPRPDETGTYYHGYIAHVPDGDILVTLRRQLEETATLLADVNDGSQSYAPGKWSLAQVLIHMSDTERVFAYRALRFARADTTPLPGFDQDVFMDATNASGRTVGSLLDEFRTIRMSTLSLLRGLDAAAWDRAGEASGATMTVRGAAWVIAGHELHHTAILRDRYLAA